MRFCSFISPLENASFRHRVLYTHFAAAPSRALFATKPSTAAIVNHEVQAKSAVSACAQSLERLGDDNPAVTMLTTVEHAVPVRTCKPLRHDYLVSPARVLTAALLFLPPATAACPDGWTPSPVSASCFKVPPERSTSLFRCVDLCEEHGGTCLHRLGGGDCHSDGTIRW